MTLKAGPADSDFVLEDYVLYNLVRAASTYALCMDKALAEQDLKTAQWRILSILKDKSPSTVSEIAERSVTKLPTLTKMLIRMEKEGLITRVPLDEDRRVVEVRMTAAAKKSLTLASRVGQAVYEQAFEGIAPQDVENMTRILKRLRNNLSSAARQQGLSDRANKTVSQ